jgi:broad specificity phosphatase PhoE
MPIVYFVSHPDVVVDPDIPVPRWPLSERGRERMRLMLAQPWVADVGAVFSSDEQKAIDGATILAGHLGLAHEQVEALGENDRSSTGYLPGEEFQRVADEFFARPHESVRGWERAVDAQRRIVTAVAQLAAAQTPAAQTPAAQTPAAQSSKGAIAVVSHGGVGTLLLCHLLGAPISRRHEQPGRSGGNYFAFEQPSARLLHEWRPIEPQS